MKRNVNALKGKTQEEKLNFLMALPYKVHVKEKKGLFYVFIPELSIISQGKSLDKAHQDVMDMKRKYFLQCLEAQVEGDIVLPQDCIHKQRIGNQLKIFLIKVILFCALFGVTVLYVGHSYVQKFNSNTIEHLAKKVILGLSTLGEKMATASVEEKQKIRVRARMIFKAFQPIYEEYQKFLLEENFYETINVQKGDHPK